MLNVIGLTGSIEIQHGFDVLHGPSDGFNLVCLLPDCTAFTGCETVNCILYGLM